MAINSVLHRVIRKLIPAGIDWETLVFYTLDLRHAPAPSEKTSQPLEYHIIESPEDSWLTVLCDAYPLKKFHLRMIHDCQQCYIAVLNGQLVAYAWVTTSSCYVSEISFHLPVGPGCIYIYDCFVRADSRGMRIYNTLLSKILTDYSLPRWPESYDTACIAVDPGNTTSMRGIKRAGFAEVARVRYLRLWAFARWYGARGISERMSAEPNRVVSD